MVKFSNFSNISIDVNCNNNNQIKELEKNLEGFLKQIKETNGIPSNADDILKSLQDNVNNIGAQIPTNFADQLAGIIATGKIDEESLAKIDKDEIHTMVATQLNQKCSNVSKSTVEGAHNAETVMVSAETAIECLTPLTDFSDLEEEIEVLKINGSLEIAFNKQVFKK